MPLVVHARWFGPERMILSTDRDRVVPQAPDQPTRHDGVDSQHRAIIGLSPDEAFGSSDPNYERGLVRLHMQRFGTINLVIIGFH
jgi:hypothetical protein